MAKHLKTEFKRIGRSGATVDGRVIDPTALEQAAKNYNKDLFTALVWPEHERWYNMGTVEELRAERNDEGGVDLFAVIAPNEYYQSINSAGQKLFTSMELYPNFRDSGEFYLTGLAATDSPASVGTSEMRFSAINNKAALISAFTEHTAHTFADDQPPAWFKRLFFFTETTNPDEELMKHALEALAARFTALETKLEAKTPAEAPDAQDKPTDEHDLAAKFSALSEKVEALTAIIAAGSADKPDDQFKQLADELKALREDFTQAVNEANGTDAGEHMGDVDDASKYI